MIFIISCMSSDQTSQSKDFKNFSLLGHPDHYKKRKDLRQSTFLCSPALPRAVNKILCLVYDFFADLFVLQGAELFVPKNVRKKILNEIVLCTAPAQLIHTVHFLYDCFICKATL